MISFVSPCCDWLTFVHDYPAEYEVEPRNGGLVMSLSSEGEIEWESIRWEDIRCPSSDTKIRVKCDGKKLCFSANIGRFQRGDNVQGFTVLECIEKAGVVLRALGYDLHGFGTRWRVGQISEWGTRLTRLDLAGNLATSSFSALSQSLMSRRLGQRLPQLGKYGPMWGYDADRGNWLKAKLYDKDAEQQGKRRSNGGATTARLEFQLGSEFLKRNGLNVVMAWADKEGKDMGKVIFGRFAEPLFKEALEVQCWGDLPAKLEGYALMWRDGTDLRTKFKTVSGYHKMRRQLLEHGIDVGVPCNVLSLTRHVQVVEVTPLENLLPEAERVAFARPAPRLAAVA